MHRPFFLRLCFAVFSGFRTFGGFSGSYIFVCFP
nr:MAG TPA: hypothetical protein [Caudoviricetes sp.]